MGNPGPPSFADLGNPLLAQVPARLDTGVVTTPGGAKAGVLTIRTASTTLSVIMSAEDLATWSGLIAGLAREVTGTRLVMPSPAETIAMADGNGRPRTR